MSLTTVITPESTPVIAVVVVRVAGIVAFFLRRKRGTEIPVVRPPSFRLGDAVRNTRSIYAAPNHSSAHLKKELLCHSGFTLSAF